MESAKHKSRFPIFLLFILLIAFAGFITAFIMTGAYYKLNKLSRRHAASAITPPIPYNHPAIQKAALMYNFRTKIAGVEEKSGQTILKTSISGINNLPEFVINDNTDILLMDNNSIHTASKSFLEPGILVDIYISYNLRTKTWFLAKVNILQPKAAGN